MTGRLEKEFKNLDDQIALLGENNRNLDIQNDAETRKHLLEKGYFNLINGLEDILVTYTDDGSKVYIDKSFDDFLELYEFDKVLSSMILRKISDVEVKLKSTISYFFAQSYCSTILDNDNYMDVNKYVPPIPTQAPKDYVKYFREHDFFKKFKYEGNFRGTFTGKIYENQEGTKINLEGDFEGDFYPYSFTKISNGKYTVNNDGNSPYDTSNPNQIKTVSRLNLNDVTIKRALVYADYIKTKDDYINNYNHVPIWVAIRPLNFTETCTLLYGLRETELKEVMESFEFTQSNDKEKFLNGLEIIRALRNHCAHFELVHLFETKGNLKINSLLIQRLNLSPLRPQFVIKLFDVLKVLELYISLDDLREYIFESYMNIYDSNAENAEKLLEIMGNRDIYSWF